LWFIAEAIEYLNHFYDNEAELARSEVLRYLTGLEQARLAEDQLPGQDILFIQASHDLTLGRLFAKNLRNYELFREKEN
jgi:hypothetical protein